MGNSKACCTREAAAAEEDFGAAEVPATQVLSEEDFPSVAIVRGRKKRVACLLNLTLDEMIDEMDSSLAEESCPSEPLTPSNLTSEEFDSLCPAVGTRAVKRFATSNTLIELFKASKGDLARTFYLEDDNIKDTMAIGAANGFACAIADPSSEDCPLVFVSSGFEAMTEYKSEAVLGRSCRFLQPSIRELNDALNASERAKLRDFCMTPQPVGTAILSLLLNERLSGKRFWNLLQMRYVEAGGQPFILAVQSELDCFMPKVLKRRVRDVKKNIRICELLGNFINALDKMRAEIKEKTSVPITELRGYYTAVMNQMEILPALTKIQQVQGEGKAEKEAAPTLTAGMTVKALEDIKYPSHKVVKNTVGNIVNIDSFGNATIKWQDDVFREKNKGLLKRDFSKLAVVQQ